MMKFNTTLLISTYNRPDFLELVLMTVASQSIHPTQIVVADDGSTNETRLLIARMSKKLSLPIEHVWHKDNGFRKTTILNKALAVCKGDYIIQIDGDILLHPRFVEDHISEARNGYFVRGSRAMITEHCTSQLINREIYLQPNSIMKGVKNRLNGYRSPLLAYFYCRETNDHDHIMGCNFAFWRSDMIRINGYNNDLSGWGHEDVEVAARLFNSGIRNRRVKFKAVCFHLFHSLCDRKNEELNKDTFKNVRKNKIVLCSNGFNQI